MKKLVLSVVGVFMMLAASAQIEQGTILAGATSNFNVTRRSPSTGSGVTYVNLDLRGGYFVIENLAVGLHLGYDHFNSDGSSGGTTAVGLFGRYYFDGKIFAGLGFESVSPSSGSSSLAIPIEVGYAAFINRVIAVEPSLFFTKGDGYNDFGLNVGFTLYLNRGE